MGKNREGKYIPPKGRPSGEGQSKAEVKTIPHIEDMEAHDAIAEKYTNGPDDPAPNVKMSKPNRNTDKPDIDKPSYS
jgi:hypothetical protein